MEASFESNIFNDIDQYMSYVATLMDIRSIQIQPGALLIKNHLLQIDDLFIIYHSTNLDVLEHFSILDNHVLFTLASPTNDRCNWCGINVPTNSMRVLHPQRKHQVLMPEKSDVFRIMVRGRMVEQEALMSCAMWEQTLKPQQAIFENQSHRIVPFRARLMRYFNSPESLSGLINNDLTMMEFKRWVLNELRMIFLGIESYQSFKNVLTVNPSRRYQTYIRAISAIEHNLTNFHSLKQICDAVGTSPRTLQLCFKELTGITPLQYLKARKLHAVREELFNSKNVSKSISHFAQNYGLNHSSRFSSQYKKMFSELPHETLHRRKRLIQP